MPIKQAKVYNDGRSFTTMVFMTPVLASSNKRCTFGLSKVVPERKNVPPYRNGSAVLRLVRRNGKIVGRTQRGIYKFTRI